MGKNVQDMTNDELLEYEKQVKNNISKYDNAQSSQKILLI